MQRNSAQIEDTQLHAVWKHGCHCFVAGKLMHPALVLFSVISAVNTDVPPILHA